MPNWAKLAIGASAIAIGAVSGAIDGACDGFMSGGIAAGASFTTVAAKGIQIQEIGKLKPSGMAKHLIMFGIGSKILGIQ